MNNFKQQLANELHKDAPYTADLHKRLLHGKSQKKKSKRIWFVSLSLAIVAVLFMLSLNLQQAVTTTTAQPEVLLPKNFSALVETLKQREYILPLVDAPAAGQRILEGAEQKLNGRMSAFEEHTLIIEDVKEIVQGDYVVVKDIDGVLKVRQVLALSGQQVETKEGTLWIDQEPLLLPGTVNNQAYKTQDEYGWYGFYFDTSQYGGNDMPPNIVRDQMLLVQALTTDEPGFTLAMVLTDNIVGEVVAIQQQQPTFILEGEQLTLYQQFKKDHNIESLIGLDPATIVRMNLMALMENDHETVYAMKPSFRNIHGVTKEQMATSGLKNVFTEQEGATIFAQMYNGVENGTVEVSGTKKSALLTFTNQMGEQTITLKTTIDGLWEMN